ncbi:MAG: hypothetical protein JO075_11320 [Acidimicrobiia bacterium]|nr:hypothetical protein [Acidimicrobiia bacterium]
MTAPTVIHGKPSPSVGSPLVLPSAAPAAGRSADVEVEDAGAGAVGACVEPPDVDGADGGGVVGVTGCAEDAGASTSSSPSKSSPLPTAHRMRRKVLVRVR